MKKHIAWLQNIRPYKCEITVPFTVPASGHMATTRPAPFNVHARDASDLQPTNTFYIVRSLGRGQARRSRRAKKAGYGSSRRRIDFSVNIMSITNVPKSMTTTFARVDFLMIGTG
jgi:hypothetical protein